MNMDPCYMRKCSSFVFFNLFVVIERAFVGMAGEYLCAVMENGRALCSPTFLFFILIISLFATETRKSEYTNEGKSIQNGELMFCSPIKMFYRFRGTKIYGKHRGKRFLNTRILYTANGRSSFQFDRIVLCGDVHPQPGPTVKRNIKYPCKECGKSVRSNQDAILCAQCKIWSHAKCIGLSKGIFKHYLDDPKIDWIVWLVQPSFSVS